MRINKSKVAIIGSGLVGSSTAFSLITQGVCDEVLMVDINAEKHPVKCGTYAILSDFWGEMFE